MLVKLTSKKLWKQFVPFAGGVFTVTTFAYTFLPVTIFQEIKLEILLGTVMFLIIVFVVLLVHANNLTSRKFRINETDVIVKFGDLFSEDGVKVIAFNEYFDTKVDNKIICESSLNGSYINECVSNVSDLDETISNTVPQENIMGYTTDRKNGGKSTKYKLGTICPTEEYFLLALTHFDEENKANLVVKEYVSCLFTMWDELNKYYNGRKIVLPLLGGGITRFNDSNINESELLDYILMTFRASKISFRNPSSLTIVLRKDLSDKISIYNINDNK